MKEYDFCELDTIGYWELHQWRNICDYLNKASYRWLSYHHFDDYKYPLLSPQGKKRRSLLWDLYKIQLIRWCSNPQAEFKQKPKGWSRRQWESSGWQLIKNWEVKIDFLEKVIILCVPYTKLPMPWIDNNPNPWDAVLSLPRNTPSNYAAVLGGKHEHT